MLNSYLPVPLKKKLYPATENLCSDCVFFLSSSKMTIKVIKIDYEDLDLSDSNCGIDWHWWGVIMRYEIGRPGVTTILILQTNIALLYKT